MSHHPSALPLLFAITLLVGGCAPSAVNHPSRSPAPPIAPVAISEELAGAAGAFCDSEAKEPLPNDFAFDPFYFGYRFPVGSTAILAVHPDPQMTTPHRIAVKQGSRMLGIWTVSPGEPGRVVDFRGTGEPVTVEILEKVPNQQIWCALRVGTYLQGPVYIARASGSLFGGGPVVARFTYADRFAPIVRLHPRDDFHPASVDWYLPRVRMRHGKPGPIDFSRDPKILELGQVNAGSITAQQHSGESSGGATKSNFYLEQPSEETRKGDLQGAMCYVHAVPGKWPAEIQYWFFYPYNEKITDLGGAHEADWEHVTVRLDPQLLDPTHIGYSRHREEEFEWRSANGLLDFGRYPRVYSARHSHGSYATAGEQDRPDPYPNDHTAEGGPRLDCRFNLMALNENTANWVNYSGRWGRVRRTDFESGPYGPKFQYWNGDPR